MAQRKSFDRFAQMSKQEELIAKKRREILEKQRTAELAKKVAASMKETKETKEALDVTKDPIAEEEEVCKEEEKSATKCEKNEKIIETTSQAAGSSTSTSTSSSSNSQVRGSLTGKTGKILFGMKRNQTAPPLTDQPPPKVQNTFCNDGSFLDHFKKILEKQEPPKIPAPVEVPVAVVVEPEPQAETETIEQDERESAPMQLHIPQPPPPQPTVPPVSVAVSVPTPPPFAFNPNFLPQGMLLQPPQQPPHPPEQPPPMPAAFFGAHFANFTPPPPPPPQLPISLANLGPLYMIPAPEPLQLSAIQAPKEFDLNAIPKPQLNLEAIQVPTSTEQFAVMASHMPTTAQHILQEQQQQQQQQQQKTQDEQQQMQHNVAQQQHHHGDNNDLNCIQLPTTIENLIALVADNGDEYEDKIRTQKNRLHPAMWFLFDKHCQQYQQYQQDLRAELLRRTQPHPYTNEIGCQQQQQVQQQQQQQQQQQSQQLMSQGNYDNSSNEAGEKYDPESAFGGDVDSDDEYMRNMQQRNRENLQRRIDCRNELSDGDVEIDCDGDGYGDGEGDEDTSPSDYAEKRRKLRKSRWGDKVPCGDATLATGAMGSSNAAISSFGNQHKPQLSTITRSDPGLLQYARLNYGSVNLTEEDWKKCEEHYKVNLLYQDMMRKRQEIDRLARSGKFKYEYDSDEDVDGGTWEHKLRTAEMEATQAWATALTKQSEGKHHIGDFLPPEELKKFMEQYEAKKNNRQPDLSDYKEYKLKEDNIGFQMLQKLGWKEGQGLGTDGAGIVDPVNKGPKRDGNQGLGVSSTVAAEDCDNEYDAYRKRMMLAYRFRPNPLNNPRRAYY